MTETTRLYPCSRRGCDVSNQDWQAFETGWPNRIRYWCLDHIPLYARLKMWIREFVDHDE